MGEAARKGVDDDIAALRERLAATRSQPGLHPYWATCPVVADEPLWEILFQEPSQEKWVGGYRTATRDLDDAVAEARQFFEMSDEARATAHPIVPRSDSYRGAERMLMALLLAVPTDHPGAGEMLEQVRSAMNVVSEAKEKGHYFGPLKIDLPVALEVDDLNVGRPYRVRVISWGEHGGDWPEWNRCTIGTAP